MVVTIQIEFPGVDPNSEEADFIVDALTLDTTKMQEEWSTNGKKAQAWVAAVDGDIEFNQAGE